MPADFNGYWKMVSNDNFEEYLKALDVNVAVRKIANLLKPDKEILQNGDHMIIKTLSTFRNYIMEFDVGKEFEEDLSGVDDRKCMTTVSWDGDKLLCVQNGEKEGRGWTQWIEGDEMHLAECRRALASVEIRTLIKYLRGIILPDFRSIDSLDTVSTTRSTSN
ncbi:hypothetical protein HGM15179_011854 [Zosterops borbonicus]|uniref:Cytosolic fatty-acid binding proteins domain-containing protein n=1 Tax=Zosterops borbonicus TaxID=364589 RepID=A0A8K1LIT2_9PASS|nr:hypothetical protein HGM15179_011854 [Zosterops borbonicus]